MKPSITVRSGRAAFLAALLAVTAAIAGVAAEVPATGKIVGRVFNPVSQEYVRNAEVRLEGTAQTAYTESDGSFSFSSVPSGQSTLSVVFSGYQPVREIVTVGAGQIAVREINLQSLTAGKVGPGEDVTRLATFTVSSEREGNAKAIMNQRRNMDITTSVSSDIFGEIPDGNVGEFLKYLPGVDIDYVQSEARGPRLGALGGQYVGVTVDGARLASADAFRTGDLSRATSFEALSITSFESIEINRTSSADSDADSPAGSINMVPRRAFDRKGRRFSFNTSLNFNSEEFTLSKTPGPDENKNYKFKPNLSLEYSDVFLKGRLGILVGVNRANSYTEQYSVLHTYNRTPTAADPRPLVLTTVDFADGPKFILKDAATFTVDFKATSRLVLSLNALYTYAEGEYWNRDFVFIATGRNTIGGDGLTRLNTLPSGATPTGQLSNQGGSAEKLTYTRTLSPKFQYKLDSWTVDGAFTYSISENNYEALERGRTNNEGGAVTGDWTATRPNSGSQEWTFRQTSGPDWYNLANFTGSGTRVNSSDRYYITELWSGQLGAKWVLPFRRMPTSIKFGGKWTEENRRNRNSDAYNAWSYIGPGGNVLTGYDPVTRVPNLVLSGNWANLGYVSPTLLDMGTSGALTMYNLGGVQGMAPRANHYSIANLFRDHPEQFVLTATPDNYYTAYIANTRNFRQTVNAGYGMVDTRPTSRLSLRFGLRGENTVTQSREFNPRLRADLIAAGYPVAATGRATTVAGLNYQYFSKPRVTRRSEYDNWFPSVLGKYRIGEKIELQAGFNKAVSRPPIDSISGVYSISESTRVVTVPNVNLQPEYSNNYQARVAYYFAPGSQLTVGASQNDIRNFRISSDLSAADFGNEDPELTNYLFRTTANSPESRRFRAMDVGYDQTLSFLPEILRGTSIGFTYSRTYANLRYVNTAPHRGSGKLGYAYKRFNGALRMVWATDRPISNVGRYLRHSASYDLSATWKLTSHLSLYVQGRNIFDQPYRSFESPPGAVEGQSGALYQYQQYGANWVFGLKGVF